MLKQLRLSGITETLDQRNREAIENKMTYPEFLALIIQDEVVRRDQKKYGTRIRRAGFRSDITLERFDFDFDPNIDRASKAASAVAKSCFFHCVICATCTSNLLTISAMDISPLIAVRAILALNAGCGLMQFSFSSHWAYLQNNGRNHLCHPSTVQ